MSFGGNYFFMEPVEIGAIFEGTVSKIMPFGAFIDLPEDKSGLVHISEISSDYVKEIDDHLQIGNTVKVKVIDIKDGKIRLSIKRARDDYSEESPFGSRRKIDVKDVSGGTRFDKLMEKYKKDSESIMATANKHQKRKGR